MPTLCKKLNNLNQAGEIRPQTNNKDNIMDIIDFISDINNKIVDCLNRQLDCLEKNDKESFLIEEQIEKSLNALINEIYSSLSLDAKKEYSKRFSHA